MNYISPRLINTLRHAPGPVRAEQIVAIYDDEARCYADLDRLMAKGLVGIEEDGVCWVGS